MAEEPLWKSVNNAALADILRRFTIPQKGEWICPKGLGVVDKEFCTSFAMGAGCRWWNWEKSNCHWILKKMEEKNAEEKNENKK